MAGMSPVSWGLAAAIAALVALHLDAERRGRPILRAAAKVGASLGFVALALSRGGGGRYAGLVLAGLALSLLGDAALLSSRRGWFLGGLAAFLLAHLCFAGAFLSSGAPPAWAVLPAAAVVGAALAWLWPRLGGMRGPVVAYALAIGAMALTAQGAPRPEARLGAVLFLASDLFVARERFVRSQPVNRLAGLPLYYAGQILIALSVG